MNSSCINVLYILRSVINNYPLPVLEEPVVLKDILDIASKQNIYPLVYEGYSDLSILGNIEFNNDWSKCVYMVSEQDNRTNFFMRIYNMFLLEGVKPVLVKGIFCRSLYGSYASYRPSGDEDIVVSKEDYYKVSKILLREGFEKKNLNQELDLDNTQEVGFYNKKERLCIEVHLNLFRKDGFLLEKANGLFSEAIKNPVEWYYNGNKFYIMDVTHNFLYIILHAYNHFLKGGVGIRQVLDINLFYQNYNNRIDLNEIYNLLLIEGADKFFDDVLNIGVNYLGFENRGRCDTNSSELLSNIMSGGVFGDPCSVYRSSINTTKSVMLSKSSNFSTLKLVLNSLFPRKEVLYSQYPELLNNKYKLPIIWLSRYKKFICKLLNGETSIRKAIRGSKEKIILVKSYTE